MLDLSYTDEERARQVIQLVHEGEAMRPARGPDIVRVFTDGSCINNGKRNAAAGIGVHWPDHQHEDISLRYRGASLLGAGGPAGTVTNQRSELEAIHVALQMAITTPGYVPQQWQIHVYSDSSYSIKALTEWVYKWEQNDWKTHARRPVKNRDLIQPIFALMGQHRVVFFHCTAHTDRLDERSRCNAIADRLAVQGAKSE